MCPAGHRSLRLPGPRIAPTLEGVAQAAAAGQDVPDGSASAGPRGGITVASKDKGGTKSSKKVATKDLKQKREAKKAKKAAHADRGY
jgi:hypothetical protein